MKYEVLWNISKEMDGVEVYRIRALKDFSNVKAGDLGGWVQTEQNLSQQGDCWIYDEACVYGNAQVFNSAEVCGSAEVYDNATIGGSAEVYGSAEIRGSAEVYGSAEIRGSAIVCGSAKVYGNTKVCSDAIVYGNAKVYDNATIGGSAEVCGSAEIRGSAKVYGNATIRGSAIVCGSAIVYGNTKVCGDAIVYGNAKVYDNAKVCGDAIVCGSAKVYGNATLELGKIEKMKIEKPIILKGMGRPIIASIKNNKVELECGCFHTTELNNFVKRIYKDGGYTKETLPKHRKEYLIFAEILQNLERKENIHRRNGLKIVAYFLQKKYAKIIPYVKRCIGVT